MEKADLPIDRERKGERGDGNILIDSVVTCEEEGERREMGFITMEGVLSSEGRMILVCLRILLSVDI